MKEESMGAMTPQRMAEIDEWCCIHPCCENCPECDWSDECGEMVEELLDVPLSPKGGTLRKLFEICPPEEIEPCSGVMGVPITFMDKYDPNQFEILGITEGDGFKECAEIDGKRQYRRIMIQKKPKETL